MSQQAEPVADTQPLSKREEELLARLLSDPTKYPMTLKTWIVAWLEGSDLTVPLSSVKGLVSRLDDLDRRLKALEP